MDTTSTSKDTMQQKDVYALVNDKIIQQLERGVIPWRQPWLDAGIPCNLISRKPYRGINLLLLAGLGYEQNFFLSYKQVNDLGGRVKRDEKGHIVTFWAYLDKNEENSEAEETENGKKKRVLRYYVVFNIAQCEKIPEDKLPTKYIRPTTSIPACEAIVENMPKCPAIRFKENRAYYDPIKDYINMPKQKSFTSDEAYYSTLFHELVHSTGHYNRVCRKGIIEMSEFGSDAYSHEELVAEIATCYLQSCTGITSEFEQSAAYIQSWLWKFKNDKRFIFSASSQAQKATDYILDIKIDDSTKDD
jgi:antirestriction protein ArdC